MSQTVDERVVEMRFDNKQFEEGASTTMSTLQKLKKSLDFSKIGDSFENINKASNKVDLAGLDKAVSGIQSKFSALEVMAITTLGNITNSFVNSAKRWVSAFTIEPLKTGFQEYETQINAVQTILANTQKEGTNIKDVNAALDELNLYADKTIYNFTEITRNIGTFTAAGVDLKTSANAIQGIANLAAVSGSNSQQASTAMYQLSQALATGTVKLMDWNSVVNAGMGGQLFQDALKETSRLLGTGADAAIQAEGSFRESLKTGWLTSEVLTETLKKFTTSGAAEYVANYTGLSKEAIESELELAKSMYGESEAIDKAAESLAKKSGKNKDEIAATLRFAQTAEDAATKVKTFTQLMDTLKEAVQSGWSQSFRIIIGDFEEAKELFTEISDAFGSVISASADARNNLLKEVFNKKDAEDYMASVVDVPKEAITQLQIVAKEVGTTSDLYKDSLDEFTNGDETLNKVMTHMIQMVSSEKDVVSYIADITGMTNESVGKLQNIGKEFGYTSDYFEHFANVLSEGDPEMQATITHLLQMNDAMQKPSGRELLIDSLRNGLKGLVSVIKPVQEAFREVFPPATAEQVYGMLEAFREFTKTLILSEKNSGNLKKAFKGLFDVVKLLGDGFFALLKLIIPIEKPVGALGSGVLDLAGAFGSLLSWITKAIRSSKPLSKAFNVLKTGSESLMGGLSGLIKTGITFVKKLSKMEGTVKLIDSVNKAFENLYKKASPYIDDFIFEVGKLFSSLISIGDINIDEALEVVSNAFADLAWEIEHFSFKTVEESFDTLRQKIKSLTDLAMTNKGFATFVRNFKKFGEDLLEAFSFESILDRMEKIMDVFGKFFNWVKNTMAPAFKDFNVGSVVATGGGLGLIYAMIKAAKAFDKIAGSIKAIPDLLGGVKDTLVAYQKDLNASAMIKIAGAIAILTASLVLLSFADTERLMEAAIALTLIAGTLMLGITKFLDAVNKGKELNNAITILAKGLSSSMKKLSSAVQIKAVGWAIKDFAKSIAIIAISIIALGIMYKKDKDSLMYGVELVKTIGIAMVSIMAGMSILGNILKGGGMANFAKAAFGILSLSASLTLCIHALNKLFKMEFPSDWEFKIKVLSGMLAGLGMLALTLGVASRIAGGNKMSTANILSIAALLVTTVMALDKLFKMKFPSDWENRVLILVGVFGSLEILMITLGIASRIAGGSIKAAGTILSICVFLGAIIAALMVLALIPGEKLTKGATSLGIVLVTLGVALAGAGKISTENTHKSVLAMAITVGAITAALAVLAMVPFPKLLKSAISLGAILIILAEDFKQVSKMTNNKAWLNITAMIAAVLGIAYSLYALSEQPWEGMLAAAVSISAVLLAFGEIFKIISNLEDLKIDKVGMFILATASLIPIGVALYELSTQPWGGMLVAAISMSAVLLSFAQTLKMVSGISGLNIQNIGLFVLATASLIPIGVALYALSEQPWIGMLSAALSISAVLLSLAVVLDICTVAGAAAGPALVGIALLDALIADLTLVLIALGALYNLDSIKTLISGGAAMLVQIGQAIGDFIGAIFNGVLVGISNALPAIGTNLSTFIENLGSFADGSKKFDMDVLKGVGILAACIIAITAAEVIAGIGTFLGAGVGLITVAANLDLFIQKLQPFLTAVEGIDAESMVAVKNLAQMIIILTAADMLNGLGRFLGISGNFSTFGDELVKFGPDIKKFAQDVKNVKPEAVQGAASAAEIMANLSRKLPATGGFAQKIFGEKSIAAFGKELVSFGPSISQFAEQVKDVKPEAVQGAASAAEIMANLASKLPSQGGLAQKLFGEKSISAFGKELVLFGPKIALFADQVKDVDPSAISGVSSITAIMSDLANNLPDSKSLWDKIFGGGKTTLSEFGKSIADFSKSLGGIKTENITNAVGGLRSIVNLSKVIGNTDASNIVAFTNSLSDIGVDSVDNFVKAFSNSKNKVSRAIQTFYKNIDDGIKKSFSSLSKTMEKRGKQIIDGLNKGLIKNYKTVTKTTTKIAKNIDKSFCKTLDIRSPSHVGALRGMQWVLGITGGIDKNSKNAEKASSNMAQKISDSFTEGLKPGAESLSSVLADVKDLQDGSLVNEETYWNNLLEIKKNGSDAEKYQDMEMQDFRSNILGETTNIYNEYIDKFKSTRDSLVSAMSIFSEVKRQEDVVNKEDLKKNLNDQINLYAEYANVMSSLNQRIDGTALIEELRTLGVESTDQLKVINSMTDEELTYYSALYDQKLQAAGVAAATQLTGMQHEVEAKLSSLFGGMYAQVDLVDFSKIFDGSIESLNRYLNDIYLPMEQMGQKANIEMQQLGTDITTGFQTGVAGLSEVGNKELGTAITGMFEGQSENAAILSKDLGKNITAGITEGMNTDPAVVQSSATELVTSITNYIKAAGEIHSPSELMKREVGAMFTQGIAAGMVEDLTSVIESAKVITTTISDSLSVEGNTAIQQSALDIGKVLCQGIQNGIIQNQSLVTTSQKQLITGLVNILKNDLALAKLSPYGQNIVQGIINGMNSKRPLSLSTVKNLCIAIITQFRISLPSSTFNVIGQSIVIALANGINDKKPLALSTVTTMCNEIVQAFKDNLQQSTFVDIGANAALGLKYGIESKIDEIADAAIEAAQQAVDSARSTLREASPSKVFFEIGEYASLGMANGIVSCTRDISIASTKAAEGAIEPVRDAVNGIMSIIDDGTFDVDPVIRPVVDLSDVQKGAKEVGYLMNQTYDLSSVYDNAISASASFNRNKTSKQQDKINGSKSSEGNSYQFVQNNYSPKALTRSEIYRQTNNQFSAFKKAVNP